EESEWDGADQAQAITKAVEALPAEQKEVFLLKVEAEMSLEEIAQMGGESREAIKSRYRYAVAKIRKWVSEENNDG
ncbi:MAG: sigma-70 family RNA polymerase sigma factor, partial [Gammaproteobacteria bacterium]|nr:sigma-70 family RNA polymerase sigma factor [Gammaproteobacteria bacterium]